jgi:hypothetical protein
MPGYSVGVVETKCSYCPFLEAGGGLTKSWKRGNILRKGSVRMVGGMLSIRRREREGNKRKGFVVFAKKKALQMWTYPAKSVDCSRDKEDIVMLHGLKKAGLMITRLQFPLRGYPVDSSTGWVHKVGVLGSFGRRLCDGDINGKDTRRGVKTSTWLASDGYVSWSNGWREWGM